LPAKRHRHFNSLYDNGWKIKDTIRLHKDHIDVIFEKPFVPNGNTKVVGFDCGAKKIFTSSEGEKVGMDLENYMRKIARKKKGSKAYTRALTERDHYINREIKKLDMNIGEAVVEDLKGLQKRVSGKLTVDLAGRRACWVYSQIQDKFAAVCEISGVRVHKVKAKDTSRTCSRCGAVDKKSRKGEVYKCTTCGYELDADYNASVNIRNRYLGVGACSPQKA
jgi:transposase